MKTDDFDYELPPQAIAQDPAEPRDASRLLVLDRRGRRWTDSRFRDLPRLLRSGDCLVVNDSRVLPARVIAREDTTAAEIELLFVTARTPERWHVLARPARRLRRGARLLVDGGAWRLRVVDAAPFGAREVESESGAIRPLLERYGRPPLPPYIARHRAPLATDAERYQTVFAAADGSVAAPTAGLHFTPELLETLRRAGIEVHAVTLHVGPATFRPIRAARIQDHHLPEEHLVISPETADAVNRARGEGRRVIACGTTTTRALESAVDIAGRVRSRTGTTALYITPGFRFTIIDGLLTNFHLPRSSLLLLVAAFADRTLVLEAYRHAAAAGYRFYSYGDAMLIL
jgi:S-adenosylmethionine:tRNA ribosyltransferase-isomerase